MEDLQPLYRAFDLDARGQVCSAEHIVAGDDVEAMDKLRSIENNPHGLELWDRTRRVGKVDALPLLFPVHI